MPKWSIILNKIIIKFILLIILYNKIQQNIKVKKTIMIDNLEENKNIKII